MYQSDKYREFEDRLDVIPFNSNMIPSQRRNRPAKMYRGAKWALKLRIMIKRERVDNPDAYVCAFGTPDYIDVYTDCDPF